MFGDLGLGDHDSHAAGPRSQNPRADDFFPVEIILCKKHSRTTDGQAHLLSHGSLL